MKSYCIIENKLFTMHPSGHSQQQQTSQQQQQTQLFPVTLPTISDQQQNQQCLSSHSIQQTLSNGQTITVDLTQAPSSRTPSMMPPTTTIMSVQPTSTQQNKSISRINNQHLCRFCNKQFSSR